MRKLAATGLSRSAVQGFHNCQTTEAYLLARAGLQDATFWDRHLRRTTASTMLTYIYNELPVS